MIDTNKTVTERYQESIANLWGLNDLAARLLMFISQKMDDDNFIHNDLSFKQDFQDALSKLNVKVPHTVSINRSFRELVEADFLSKYSKGVYKVNPVYFWKDTEVTHVKLILEFDEQGTRIAVRKNLNQKYDNHVTDSATE